MSSSSRSIDCSGIWNSALPTEELSAAERNVYLGGSERTPPMTTPEITLHGLKLSGHAHRVELLLELLELPYRYVETTAEERASPAFRAMNPLGQVPVLQDGDLTLADSNAILVYLVRRYAQGSAWLPADPVGSARLQRWLSIAAGELRFGPAAARIIALFNPSADPKRAIAIADQNLPCNGCASDRPRVPCGGASDPRRRRLLRLHRARAGGRRLAGALSRDPRMAGSDRSAASLQTDGLDGGKGVSDDDGNVRLQRRRADGAADRRLRAGERGHPIVHDGAAPRVLRASELSVRGRHGCRGLASGDRSEGNARVCRDA